MYSVKVDLGSRSYPIFIGDGITEKLGEMLKLYGLHGSCVVVTDSDVPTEYVQALQASLRDDMKALDTLTIPAGEASKSLQGIEGLVTQMLERKYDRHVTVLAFGGGVVGDVAGFLAAIYKRGVSYVQMPTTLLAQVDSSIGGKTGVNHPLGKNQIGVIYQPKLVWTDLAFLQTLPRKQVVSGLGEVVKYAVIRDAVLFEFLETHLQSILELNSEHLLTVVQRCAEIKAEVVSEDECESGSRMILNCGHTVGHAIEAAAGYSNISHGEAVLLGIVAEAKIAFEMGHLSDEVFIRIEHLIARLERQTVVRSLPFEELWRLMQSDKKSQAGKLRFVLPTAIGDVTICDDIPRNKVKRGVDYLFQKNLQ